MADIRCPMCGKFASEELDTCPSCQARLKPFTVSPSDDEKSIHAGEALTRLGNLGSESEIQVEPSSPQEESMRPGDAPTQKNTAELEFALPNWLRKLRGQPKEKPAADVPTQPRKKEPEESPKEETIFEIHGEVLPDIPASAPNEEVSDWLSGLDQTTQEEEHTPAWMSNIEIPPKKGKTPAVAPVDDGNWLNDLRGGSPGQELESFNDELEAPKEEPVFEPGIPEWMKKLQAEVDSQAEGTKPVEEDGSEEELGSSPDWLIRLQAETQSNATSADVAPLGQGGEAPNWLGKLGPETSAVVQERKASSSEPDAPDWLLAMQAEARAYAQTDDPTETKNPDWIKDGGLELPGAAEETGAPGDWLNSFSAVTRPSTEEGGALESESQDLMKTADFDLQANAGSAELDSPEPEWLRNVEFESQVFPPQAFTEPVVAASEEEMPEWLKNLGTPEPQANLAQSELSEPDGDLKAFQFEEAVSEPARLDETASTELEPNWLSNLKAEGEIGQQETSKGSQSSIPDENPDLELVPDWLKNIDVTDTISNSGTPALLMEDDPFPGDTGSEGMVPGELPDWLSNLKPDATTSQTEAEKVDEKHADDTILPADLPSWVQAMRPVETMMADLGVPTGGMEQTMEKAGPLAGLQGVLPASPGLGKLRKPLNFSVKLRVTEGQSQHAAHLEQMLEGETQAKTATLPDKKLSKRLVRWLVAALLILAMGFPALSGMQFTPSPSHYPPELLAAREVILGLPANSAVLLVFDYEPAYSGELEVAAAPLVNDLLFKGVRLAIVSTSPTGPALAEHFLKTTQGQHNYQSGQQYANLGYLAGGASGVLSFGLNPSLTIPSSMDGSLPWQTSMLQDIHALSDFSVVIVLTDNSDTARIWVEQTSTILGQTPLLMAISAQAEPMIRPYYDSKQIKGLVTGLAGGKAYEQALQLSDLGQLYWDSYSSGLFIAELIIIFGSLWSLISGLRNRKSAQEEEA